MKYMKTLLCLLLATLSLTVYSSDTVPVLNAPLITSSSISNIRQPDAQVFSSGQPSQDELQLLQRAGIKHIVNLRPSDEITWDEKAAVLALGMQYHSIPVAGAADITVENAEKLADLLSQLDGEASLLHCASGNRVGGLMAVIAAKLHGQPIEDALLEGQRWGLTGLTPVVRAKLSQH
ncbi:fused DSP-PTPase phosphatase/NAD kinase-like protein [Dasania marina]|uniref:fused DSP-PTPase phosphatase/NAD kinase-like protein n=1 Tax=Dasania marina TaxID=471499 RepID=UPI0003635AE8|nr:sulfur transferase domain-containing protein [Dasania marina]